MCKKKFSGVSYGGYGYMLIWFCPKHGHTYGFHLINKALKGAGIHFVHCTSFWSICQNIFFYDFVCSLSEYALSRAPDCLDSLDSGMISSMPLATKGGMNFKSGRVDGLEGINTEICEQVNSYLQCIKFTGSHLSQEHFMFFTQFFLYLLNKCHD